VTLGGSNEHFTTNDGVSAYAKYVSGNADTNIMFASLQGYLIQSGEFLVLAPPHYPNGEKGLY